jgi:hypothetical protein
MHTTVSEKYTKKNSKQQEQFQNMGTTVQKDSDDIDASIPRLHEQVLGRPKLSNRHENSF